MRYPTEVGRQKMSNLEVEVEKELLTQPVASTWLIFEVVYGEELRYEGRATTAVVVAFPVKRHGRI